MSNGGPISLEDLLDAAPSADIADEVAGRLTMDELLDAGPVSAPQSSQRPPPSAPVQQQASAPWLVEGVETAMETIAPPTPWEPQPTPEFLGSKRELTTGERAATYMMPPPFTGPNFEMARQGADVIRGLLPEWMGGTSYSLPEAERKREVEQQLNISSGDRDAIVAYTELLEPFDPDIAATQGNPVHRQPVEEFVENAGTIEGRAKSGLFANEHYTAAQEALQAEIDSLVSWQAMVLESEDTGADPSGLAGLVAGGVSAAMGPRSTSAEQRIGQLRGMKTILDESLQRGPGGLDPSTGLLSLGLVLGAEEAKHQKMRPALVRRPSGALGLDVTDVRDPYRGLTLEQTAAAGGVGGLVVNAYTNGVQTLAGLISLGMGAVKVPAWTQANSARSIAASRLKHAGKGGAWGAERDSIDASKGILADLMRGKGVNLEPRAGELLRYSEGGGYEGYNIAVTGKPEEEHRIAFDPSIPKDIGPEGARMLPRGFFETEKDLVAREVSGKIMTMYDMGPDGRKEAVSRGEIPAETVLAFEEAMSELPAARARVIAQLQDDETWDAPIKAGEALYHHFKTEKEELGWSYWYHNPLDFLGVLSGLGSAARAGGRMAAKFAPAGRAAPAADVAKINVAAGEALVGAGMRPWERLTGGRAYEQLSRGAQRRGAAKLEFGEEFPYGRAALEWEVSAEAKLQAMANVQRAKAMDKLGARIEHMDPFYLALKLPAWIAGRANNASLNAFLLKPSERGQFGVVFDGTRMSFGDYLSAQSGELASILHQTQLEVQSAGGIGSMAELEAEAMHRMLRADMERGRLGGRMYVRKIKKDPGDPGPEYSSVMLNEAEVRAAENVGPTPAEAMAEGADLGELKPHELYMLTDQYNHSSKAKIDGALSVLPDGNSRRLGVGPGSSFDSNWSIAQRDARTTIAFLAHEFEDAPLYLEQLSIRADDIRVTREKIIELSDKLPPEVSAQTKVATVEGLIDPVPVGAPVDRAKMLFGRETPSIRKARKDLRVERKKLEKQTKELNTWARGRVKDLRDPKRGLVQMQKEIPAHLEHLRKDPKSVQDPTQGLPSLGEMAAKYSAGDAIDWVPAQHVSLAHVVMDLLAQRKTNPNFADLRFMEGGHIYTADMFLRRYEMFTDEMDYLKMLQQEYNVGSLDGIEAVYSNSLPLGIDSVNILKADRVRTATSALRKQLLHGGMESVGEGLLSELTFWRNVETYAPDFYKQYHKEFMEAGVGKEDWMESLKFLAHRGYVGDRFRKGILKAFMSVAEREGVGLITDAKWYVGFGVSMIKSDIHFKRMAEQLMHMKQSRYNSANGTWEDGLSLVAEEMTPELAREGYKVLRDQQGVRWLNLNGKAVHPEVYHYLKGARNSRAKLESFGHHYQVIMNKWRFGMTVLNPATHLRNTWSNVVMADMAYLNPFLSDSARTANWRKTIEEYQLREGDAIDEAIRGNLFGSTFVDAELKTFSRTVYDAGRDYKGDLALRSEEAMGDIGWGFMRNHYGRANHGLRKMGHALDRWKGNSAKLYRAEDEIFKLWRFKQIRLLQKEFQKTGKITKDMRNVLGSDNKYLLEILEPGRDIADASLRELASLKSAAKESHRWFFDYSDVPGWVEAVRKTNLPFFTYTYKAIPAVVEWMAKHPIKGFYWRELFDYMYFFNEYIGGDPDPDEVYDRELMRAGAPAYLQVGGIMLPGSELFGEEKGKAEFSGLERTRRSGSKMTRMVERRKKLQPVWDVQFWTQLGGLYKPGQPNRQHVLDLLLQNPVVNSIAAIVNKPSYDLFGSSQIWSAADATAGDAWRKHMAAQWRIWAPNVTPGIPTRVKDENGEPIDYDSGGAHILSGALTGLGVGIATGNVLAGAAGALAGLAYGPNLVPGGRSWQKMYAAAIGLPDYRVSSHWKRIREPEDTLKDFTGMRYDYLRTDIDMYEIQKENFETRNAAKFTEIRNKTARSKHAQIDAQEAEALERGLAQFRSMRSRAKFQAQLKRRAMQMVAK